jgi:hypothetical protein
MQYTRLNFSVSVDFYVNARGYLRYIGSQLLSSQQVINQAVTPECLVPSLSSMVDDTNHAGRAGQLGVAYLIEVSRLPLPSIGSHYYRTAG